MDCYICGEPVRGDLKAHLRQHSEEIRSRLNNPADAGIEWIRKQGVDPRSFMSVMDLTEVCVEPNGGVEVCIDPSGDESAKFATSARCPYCTKAVSMSRATLDYHRAADGTCPGAGRVVERVKFGMAVLATMDARGALRECGICGKNIRVDQNGNFKEHAGRYGAPCTGSGKYAGQ